VIWLVFPWVRTLLERRDGGLAQGLATTNAEDLNRGEVILLDRPQEASSRLFILSVQYATLQALRLLATMVSAMVLRRHLMVWKIFAPRFVFEAVGFLVSVVTITIGYVLALRSLVVITRLYRSLDEDKK